MHPDPELKYLRYAVKEIWGSVTTSTCYSKSDRIVSLVTAAARLYLKGVDMLSIYIPDTDVPNLIKHFTGKFTPWLNKFFTSTFDISLTESKV